jgi:hypothetical protein
MTDPNESAFGPSASAFKFDKEANEGKYVNKAIGLSKREYFAAAVMQGYIASFEGGMSYSSVAKDVVAIADALIAELNK